MFSPRRHPWVESIRARFARRPARPAGDRALALAGEEAHSEAGEAIATAAQRPIEIARKLDRLFKTMHSRRESEYRYEQVTEGIAARGGPTMSAAYLRELRTGERKEATTQELEALAAFFGLKHAAYFFDEAAAERIDAQLELLGVMRDTRAWIGCIRGPGFKGTPQNLRWLAEMLREVHALEGQMAVPVKSE